jgi:hypothetical protein
MAHKDTSIVSEAVVLAEPRPEFTSTWHPYSHREVIETVGAACDKLGWSVARKTYSIKKDDKMFGVWDLEKKGGELVKTKERTLSLGLRNSIAKTASVGLCAGLRVFVCDNLVFRGDFVMFRKHTGLLSGDELGIMAEEALVALSTRFTFVDEWWEGLKKVELTDPQASALMTAAMNRPHNPIIPPSKFGAFYDLYFGKGTKYTPTLHGFHGAVTEMLQQDALHSIGWRSKDLVTFLDLEAPVILGQHKGRIHFDEIREKAKEGRSEKAEEEKAASKEEQAILKEKIKARLKEAKVEAKAQAKEKALPKGKKPAGKALAGQKQAPKKGKGKAPVQKKEEPVKVVREVVPGVNLMTDGSLKKKEPEKKAELGISFDGKLVRRTARVKAREVIASESKPVKTKLQKAPKGEKITTAKASTKKAKLEEEEDILFCSKCEGEFLAGRTVRVDGDVWCLGCNEARKEEAKAEMKKRPLKKS